MATMANDRVSPASLQVVDVSYGSICKIPFKTVSYKNSQKQTGSSELAPRQLYHEFRRKVRTLYSSNLLNIW